MERGDIAVTAFLVAYNGIALVLWWRAARHYKRGVSAATRIGLGLGFLRAENYTPEGQPYRRALVWMYIAALPAILAWAWLWDAL